MLRTINDVPLPIYNNEGIPLFTRVGPADRLSVQYKIINYNHSYYYGNNKFDKNAVYVFYFNNKLYLYSKSNDFKSTKYIDIVGVFQNPMESGVLNNVNYDETSEYPVSYNMVSDIENIIIQEWYKIAVSQAGDKESNQVDDTINKISN